MTQDSAAISFATSDWAMAALEPHIGDCLAQIRKRRHPLIRVAYIARQRETPEERPWNWCPTCDVEIPARRVHQSAAPCRSCGQVFIVQHEGTLANERLRLSPGYSGPYHDTLSAIWYDWTLRPARPLSWPDGALAFDVTPFELPTRRSDDGIRVLTRRERRHEARRGHRGRRGSRAVPKMMRLWINEPFEPEGWREAKLTKRMSAEYDGLASVPELRMEYVEFRRMRVGFGVKLCRFCECELRVILTLYAATELPHVVSAIQRAMRRATEELGLRLVMRGACFCT